MMPPPWGESAIGVLSGCIGPRQLPVQNIRGMLVRRDLVGDKSR